MNTINNPWPTLKRSLVSILRGIKPEETEAVIAALLDAGFEAIEIPLNSPEPFKSIEIAARIAPAYCLIGAGTVLSTGDVDRLADAGGRLMVSPNVDKNVMTRAQIHNMTTMPGVFTPTEAFTAVACRASALKFFPAGTHGPAGIAAIRAVLPPGITVAAVGGVSESDFEAYSKVGVHTFGLGSSLYKAGRSAEEVGTRARRIIAAYDDIFGH